MLDNRLKHLRHSSGAQLVKFSVNMENAEIRIDVAEKMERLRSLIMDLMSKHLYSSAIFYADKLVTLSDSDQSDMYLLAQAYFLSKQYRRAVNLVTKEDLFTLSNRFKYLAARCLVQIL